MPVFIRNVVAQFPNRTKRSLIQFAELTLILLRLESLFSSFALKGLCPVLNVAWSCIGREVLSGHSSGTGHFA